MVSTVVLGSSSVLSHRLMAPCPFPFSLKIAAFFLSRNVIPLIRDVILYLFSHHSSLAFPLLYHISPPPFLCRFTCVRSGTLPSSVLKTSTKSLP